MHSLKIFKVINKANNIILILAHSSEEAKKVALNKGHGKNSDNLKTIDITTMYKQANPLLNLYKLQQGKLIKIMDKTTTYASV